MTGEIAIRLRLDNDLTKELASYLEEEIAAERAPRGLLVAYRPAARPRGGLGLIVPPELHLAIPPEIWIAFAKKLAEGAGGAIGTGIGSFLWAKIKEFLDHKHLSGTIKLSINEESIALDTTTLPNAPPASLHKLDVLTGKNREAPHDL